MFTLDFKSNFAVLVRYSCSFNKVEKLAYAWMAGQFLISGYEIATFLIGMRACRNHRIEQYKLFSRMCAIDLLLRALMAYFDL